MKKLFILSGVILLFGSSCAFGQRSARASVLSETRNIDVHGKTRNYRVFVPDGLEKGVKLPLVLVFHGGGGTAVRMERFTKFSVLAERERFIVIYPQGLGNQWNDGRTFSGRTDKGMAEDLLFAESLIDYTVKELGVDKKRVFATGASNGAFFSNLLAARMSGKIAAIAPVIGGVGKEVARDFKPEEPVSVFVIQGTKDPLVPYEGGTVARNRGMFVSTEEGIRLWRRHNGTAEKAFTYDLEDKNTSDGCTVETSLWRNGRKGTEVMFYKLNGAGHTWPGGSQYLPKRLVGGVCGDFDATSVIWDFFKSHPKQ